MNIFVTSSTAALSLTIKQIYYNIPGPVRSAQLNFNEKGVSKGVATVLFVRPGDAHKAFQEYNNRPLDNKPMRIEMIINPESNKIKQLDSRLGGHGGVGKQHGGRGGRGG
jgi:THO complex subunit 4